jgi:peptidoglycan/xylan/chitin deacetylase (PgdA/CDA1 family)
MNGNLIISLDFELHWGAAEKWDLSKKKSYFDATRESIPLVLNLFKKYDIHATWATVGFLFAKNKEQLLDFCPTLRPSYDNNTLSYYNLIDNNEVGSDEKIDPYHYAPSLISLIIDTPNQELATHTFAHYYCNEKGQNKLQFDADLKAAQQLSKTNFNYDLKSLVFPRNQFNNEYLSIAKENGIEVVRSNPNVWFWKSNSKFIALARACDTLFSISKTLTFNKAKFFKNEVLMLPSSRFFRPYTNKERFIQALKMRRIINEMTYAAKSKRSYHLWWHPHNFGYSTQENLMQLESILIHYSKLNKQYGFISKTMIEMKK